MVQPDIVAVELIERNMHDHKTADMIDVAVHEIVGNEFQDLELAMRYLTVSSMLDYWNQNSCHPPVKRMMCSYAHKNSWETILLRDNFKHGDKGYGHMSMVHGVSECFPT